MIITVLVVLLAVNAFFWVWTHIELSRVIRCEPYLRTHPAPLVPNPPPKLSVLIPAHNESRNIGRALQALLVQDYPDLEVIVASDRSTDDTCDIVRSVALRDPRVRLFENSHVPDDWAGKPYVLQCASELAHGDLILFMDADVALEPGALSAMVAHLCSNQLDLLSLFLRHESDSLWDKVLHILVGAAILLRFPTNKVNDPSRRMAFANGQNIIVRSEVYQRIGRHEPVKAFFQDDLAFAKTVKHGGHRIGMAYGFDLASARWYTSLHTACKGWSRMVIGLLEGRLSEILFAFFVVLWAAVAPLLLLIFSSAALLAGTSTPLILVSWSFTLAISLLMLWLFLRLLLFTRGDLCCLPLLPGAAFVFLWIIGSAFFKRLSGRGLSFGGKRFTTSSAKA